MKEEKSQEIRKEKMDTRKRGPDGHKEGKYWKRNEEKGIGNIRKQEKAQQRKLDDKGIKNEERNRSHKKVRTYIRKEKDNEGKK